MAIDLNENSQIRKSKALIFAQTAPSNLPVPAQRLFLALLSNIDETDEDKTSFVIRGKDIASLANLPANVVGQQLENMSIKADSLRQYTLIIKEDDGNDLRVGLISSTKYLKGLRAIRISVDPYLMPYLRKMKEQFVISYSAGGAMKFRSEYSLPFYDMMLYYLREGGYHYFTIDEVRRMFNIPDGKVTKTSTLNQKVITPAMKDVNTNTNLEVEVKYEKAGRTIIGYHFYIKDKIKAEISRINNENEELLVKLIKPPINFNKHILAKFIDEYGIDSIKNNYNYTLKKQPDNISKYLYWAITNQIYEKEREIEQVQKINESFKPENIPKYKEPVEESNLFVDESEENNIEPDFEQMKISNPNLYAIMERINNKLKEDKK